MLNRLRALTFGLLAAVCLPTNAGVITLDFNSGGGIYRYAPYYEDGFRVYPLAVPLPSEPGFFVENHFDMTCLGGTGGCPGYTGIFAPPGYDGSVFLGTDSTGSRVVDSDGNVIRYMGTGGGPYPPRIRIDFFGALFNALDFQAFGGYLTSSKGGIASGSGDVLLTGDLWRQIEWIDMSPSGFVGAPVGIDNLRLVTVSEPSTLAILGLGLAGLAFTRRRKR